MEVTKNPVQGLLQAVQCALCQNGLQSETLVKEQSYQVGHCKFMEKIFGTEYQGKPQNLGPTQHRIASKMPN